MLVVATVPSVKANAVACVVVKPSTSAVTPAAASNAAIFVAKLSSNAFAGLSWAFASADNRLYAANAAVTAVLLVVATVSTVKPNAVA